MENNDSNVEDNEIIANKHVSSGDHLNLLGSLNPPQNPMLPEENTLAKYLRLLTDNNVKIDKDFSVRHINDQFAISSKLITFKNDKIIIGDQMYPEAPG